MSLHPALLRDADEALRLLLRRRLSGDRWAEVTDALTRLDAALRAEDVDRMSDAVGNLAAGEERRASIHFGDDQVDPPPQVRELVNRLVTEIDVVRATTGSVKDDGADVDR